MKRFPREAGRGHRNRLCRSVAAPLEKRASASEVGSLHENFDVIVVGAGMLGIAHAWAAAKRGLSVAVIERSRQAHGATIRNFGQ